MELGTVVCKQSMDAYTPVHMYVHYIHYIHDRPLLVIQMNEQERPKSTPTSVPDLFSPPRLVK